MAENGNGATASDPQKLALLERAFVNLQSVLDDRVRYGASIGMSYNGQRDIYSALGWHTYLSFDDFYLKYQRQDIAGRIVDLPVDACWRDGFELQDDENKPDVDTPFIKSWKALDKRLGLAAWLTKLDRLSGIGRYGVLYLGVRNQNPVMPLAKTNEQALSYLSVFVEPNALIDSYDTDLASERFGLPVTYSLKTNDFSGADRVGARQTRSSRSAQVHWSRCIHCAEMTEDVKTLGTPRLQRVFNLLEALQLVTGGSSEAFWRSARPRYHANVGKEAQGFISPEELEGLGDQLAKMVHNYQDWIRTSYTTVDQLAATPADPSGHVAVILDLMSSAVAIPKRILLGSERGELASSQDAMEWAHRIAERQQSHVEPNIIRPFIDRLVEAGIMPEPSQGEYEIQWPDLTGPSADQRATLADRVASAEARHAQAEMLGKPSITRNELRELLGLDAIDAMDEEVPGETPPLPSKPAPPAPAPGQPQVGPDGKPVPGAPPQEQPAKPEQPAKAAAGLRDFASTQLNLIGADAAMVLAVKLPANCARETNPHITVRYGVEQDEPGAALAKALAGVGPVTARIDGYRVFQPEHEAGDVPVLTVSSPALAELRALVERHCECAPPTYDYAPHVTLGTCAGALAVPLDVMGLIGRELSFDTLTFGARDGTVTTLPLVQPAKAAEAQSGGPFVGADADADLRVNALFATIMAAVNAATDRIFGAATMDSIRAALIDFGQRMVARFGRPEQEFDLATQSAIEYLRGYGAEHVAGIGDTTRKLLRDTLTEGLRNGEDQAALARRVKLYFRGVSAGRARVIAATESHNATQHGAFVGLLQAGVTAKQWISGEHVTSTPSRPTHRELHGQIRHIGDPFVIPSNGLEAMRPGNFGVASEDCNCNCVIQPAGNYAPDNLAAAAAVVADPEWPRRMAVHERRVLAAVRRGLRAQQAAVLAVLAGGPMVATWDESKHPRVPGGSGDKGGEFTGTGEDSSWVDPESRRLGDVAEATSTFDELAHENVRGGSKPSQKQLADQLLGFVIEHGKGRPLDQRLDPGEIVDALQKRWADSPLKPIREAAKGFRRAVESAMLNIHAFEEAIKPEPAAAWDESKHPRDPGGEGGGQWVDSGGEADEELAKLTDKFPAKNDYKIGDSAFMLPNGKFSASATIAHHAMLRKAGIMPDRTFGNANDAFQYYATEIAGFTERTGAIRIAASGRLNFQLGKMPTNSQLRSLRRLLDGNDGETVYVDVVKGGKAGYAHAAFTTMPELARFLAQQFGGARTNSELEVMVAAVLAVLAGGPMVATWDESKHPRVPGGSGDPSGEWTSEGAGGTVARDFSKTVPASLHHLLEKYGPVALHDGSPSGSGDKGPEVAYYSFEKNAVYNLQGDRRSWVIQHEWGHYIDHQMGGWSATSQARMALKEDAQKLLKPGEYSNLIQTARARGMEGVFASYVQAATASKAGYGHPKSYYAEDHGRRGREMFANAIAMRSNPKVSELARQISPRWYAAFEEAVKS